MDILDLSDELYERFKIDCPYDPKNDALTCMIPTSKVKQVTSFITHKGFYYRSFRDDDITFLFIYYGDYEDVDFEPDF